MLQALSYLNVLSFLALHFRLVLSSVQLGLMSRKAKRQPICIGLPFSRRRPFFLWHSKWLSSHSDAIFTNTPPLPLLFDLFPLSSTVIKNLRFKPRTCFSLQARDVLLQKRQVLWNIADPSGQYLYTLTLNTARNWPYLCQI